ncbi:dihydrodipicolinate synthetase [Flavobacteriaceae bacterium (ex Bugula neritina AB1)]|nr:dihydrodipicolinate synthetase [Flavobacteriaceae bacterium (ex Bugula neritina AB1)]
MIAQNFLGLIAAPITPMYKNGDVNYDRIQDLVQLYEKNGVSGAFVCGTTGEGTSLQLEEIKEIASAWARAGGNLKKILSVGGTCLRDMKALAAHAQTIGFEGVSMLCPFYFKPKSEEELLELVKEVSAEAPALDFYYYHIPVLSGAYFSMRKFLELADPQIPNLRGLKFTHNDLYDFYRARAFKKGKFNMLWGSDEVLLSGLVSGANGAVGSTYNYAAPLYKKVIDAFNKGEIEEARHWQDKSVEMVKLLIQYGGTGATKAFMKIIGLDCGNYRLPVLSPSAAEISELESELKKIGFFDYCSEL